MYQNDAVTDSSKFKKWAFNVVVPHAFKCVCIRMYLVEEYKYLPLKLFNMKYKGI